MGNNQMMLDLLKTYGAAPTPRNIAQAQAFFASNPDQMERRAMGMRGSSGNEDNTDVLGLQLDKLMQASDSNPAAVVPPTAQEQPASTVAPTPRRAAPTSATMPVQTQGLQYNPNQNLGPMPARDSNAMSADTINAVSGAQAGMPVTTPAPVSDNNWLLPMLTALLGASSKSGLAQMGGRGPAAAAGDAIVPDAKSQVPATQGTREVKPAYNAAGKRVAPSGEPPIVPIPEIGDSTAKKRLSEPNKKLPAYDPKERVQREYDSGNAELDQMEQSAKEHAKQIAKDKAAKAARAVKK